MDHNDLFKLCESLSLLDDEDIPTTTFKREVKQSVKYKRWVLSEGIPMFQRQPGSIRRTQGVSMNQELGMILGKMVGLMEELDTGSSRDCLDRYRFLQVKINMDVLKPLKRALQVLLDGFYEMATIIVRYEHLLKLRFQCGILRHPLRKCSSSKPLGEETGSLKYRAWIRVGLGTVQEP
ncbi:hypothetical protein Ddye_030304 [Dipteronia dyeriana]|uniref:Uncharacterized protein n=1 Tax=Dipteronia dyeriana TaxID=168575 RepID=A0AAD9TG90_9ROSI|nr:hypothetical protein Ddye_030304 [Dipteronia dyeriana]